MTTPAEYINANRRLCILKLLIEDGGHSNESVLEIGLNALGHHAGMDRDYVRARLRELDEYGAITLEYYQDKVMVAHITKRGVSAAQGRIKIDGVAAPALGD
jgi:hypothetical protein